MKLYFKQHMFSFLDSYSIYNESKDVEYSVRGRLNFGHYLEVYNKNNVVVGHIEQELFHMFHPTTNIYIGSNYLGNVRKKFTLFSEDYNIDFKGWTVEGDIFVFEYSIYDVNTNYIGSVSKELFHLTDHYVIDIKNESDALIVLMFTLAIDAEKCSRK